jgi:AraC family transcriptional regulator
MEPKIVTLGPIHLAGQPYFGSPEGGEFGKAWARFDTKNHPVPNRTDPKLYYGLEIYGPEFMSEHKWTYMPCVEVRDFSELSGLLFGKTLPARTYAVFTALHGLASIPETFMYAYDQWLPASKYEATYEFDFEFYDDDRFHGDGPDEQIDLYIPVREKAA